MIDFEEAQQIARVLSMADDGCSGCVRHLAIEMGKSFPQFDWKELVGRYYDGEPRSAPTVEVDAPQLSKTDTGEK